MEKINVISEVLINKEAQASLDNPTLTKLSFVFTDNQPNGNNKAIPTSAFPKIIKTGVFMPIKMAEGEIALDHTGAVPLGVIASLKEKKVSEGIDQVVGEAVLWSKERPEDVDYVKTAFASGEKLNISWELLYSDSEIDDNGVEWLSDPVVKAATFVGIPAYLGRTPVLELASQNLPDNNYLHIEPSEDGNGTKYFPYKDIEGHINGRWLQSALDKLPTSDLSEDTKLQLENEIKIYLESQSAVWTTAYKNSLPDSSFLYIESGGTKDSEGKTTPRSLRHFPYKDADGKVDLIHLRNALSRIPQSNLSESIKKELTNKAEKILTGQKNQGNSAMNPDEIKALQDKVAELESQLAEAKKNLEAKSNLEASLTQKDFEIKALKEFKAAVEEKEAQAALLSRRLEIFASAGISLTPEEIEAKKAYWLRMDDEQFTFLVGEMKPRIQENSSLQNKVPDRVTGYRGTKSALDIVKDGLKELGKK